MHPDLFAITDARRPDYAMISRAAVRRIAGTAHAVPDVIVYLFLCLAVQEPLGSLELAGLDADGVGASLQRLERLQLIRHTPFVVEVMQ